MSERKPTRTVFTLADLGAKWILFLGAAVSLLAMLLLLAAGITCLFRAAAAFGWCMHWPGFEACPPDTDGETLTLAIKGLELLLLAPLGYLLLMSLAVYIELYRVPRPGTGIQTTAIAGRQLTQAKALAMSLLISTVAVDLVGKLLGETPAKPMTWSLCGIEFVMILVFVAYYLVLQRHAAESPREEVRAGERPTLVKSLPINSPPQESTGA